MSCDSFSNPSSCAVVEMSTGAVQTGLGEVIQTNTGSYTDKQTGEHVRH